MAYVLLIAGSERHAVAVAGGIVRHAPEEALGLPDTMRADLDAALASDPTPETESHKRLRSWGLS